MHLFVVVSGFVVCYVAKMILGICLACDKEKIGTDSTEKGMCAYNLYFKPKFSSVSS